jgi:hypothetical protein
MRIQRLNSVLQTHIGGPQTDGRGRRRRRTLTPESENPLSVSGQRAERRRAGHSPEE